jgi:hypothetical protein
MPWALVLLCAKHRYAPLRSLPMCICTFRASEELLNKWFAKTRQETQTFVHRMRAAVPAEAGTGHELKEMLQPGLEVLRFLVDSVVYR